MEKLNILWTNDSIETAKTMVFMYTINSKRKSFWDEVNLIIWGATAKLAATNDEIKALIQEAMSYGVKVTACITCAEIYGVKEELESQGIELFAYGMPLTNIIKNEHLITI